MRSFCLQARPFTAVTLVRKLKQRAALTIGFTCFLLSAWIGTQLTSQWSLPEFRLIMILQTFGEEIVFLAAVATLFSNVDPARAISLTAYVQVMRLICSETVAAIMVRPGSDSASNCIPILSASTSAGRRPDGEPRCRNLRPAWGWNRKQTLPSAGSAF